MTSIRALPGRSPLLPTVSPLFLRFAKKASVTSGCSRLMAPRRANSLISLRRESKSFFSPRMARKSRCSGDTTNPTPCSSATLPTKTARPISLMSFPCKWGAAVLHRHVGLVSVCSFREMVHARRLRDRNWGFVKLRESRARTRKDLPAPRRRDSREQNIRAGRALDSLCGRALRCESCGIAHRERSS
jgi:hypothetical protein